MSQRESYHDDPSGRDALREEERRQFHHLYQYDPKAEKPARPSKLGTAWVGKGEGATLADLCGAAGLPVKPGDEAIKTDLALTGAPWQDYDFRRLSFAQKERQP
jgi:hypothetical protein